jgi:membrane-bound lytic murein transglycosylase B
MIRTAALWTVTLAALTALACSGMGSSDPGPAPAPSDPPAEATASPPPGPTDADLQLATDPRTLAQLLARAERRIRDPEVPDDEAGRWGHVQQRVYRALAADDALAAAVQESIPPELRPVVEQNVYGTREIALTVTKLATDLPDWRIVSARPMQELKGFYQEAAARFGVPWTALASIHLNETRMGRLRGVSPAGARGPMQFMPPTWRQYGLGGDVELDRDAIAGAAHYLSRSGWATNRRRAIRAYNRSEHYVDAILAFMEQMDADSLAYRGYWGWQVYYRTVAGSIWLPEGYEQSERVSIEAWCRPRGEPYCPGGN